MSSRRKSYADAEAHVGLASDSEGEDCEVSADESEGSANEYDMNDGFLVDSEEEGEPAAKRARGGSVRPVLPKDIEEEDEEQEEAVMTAEAIRKRSREHAAKEAAAAALQATAKAALQTTARAVAATAKASPVAKPEAAQAAQAAQPSSFMRPRAPATEKAKAVDTAASSSDSSPVPQAAPPAKRSKMLDSAQIPPKPLSLSAGAAPKAQKAKRPKAYLFRVDFTDGVSARKFLDVVASAVAEMRFHISAEKGFTGLRLEAHDSNWHTAIRSQLECSLTAGEHLDGRAATLEELNGTSFTVSAARFMTALDCALLKDTTLSLTRYHSHAKEEVTFEAITNEDDVRTAYAAPLIASPDTQLGSLSQVVVQLGFHVNVNIDVLAKLCSIAKKCAAATMDFEVFQAVDTRDEAVLHSRMHIGFEDFGGHDFYLTARKSGNDWVPVTGPSEAEREEIAYARKSSNSYDAAKLRLFVGKLATDWVLVHLSNNSATKPIVLEASMGSGKSNHAIMVAPREQ